MMRLILVLLSASVIGWVSFAAIVSFDLFETAPLLRRVLFAIGMTITTVTLVVALATFILRIVLEGVFHTRPSDLVRAIIYSVLTFAGSLLLLSQFGVDVSAILTTSAILGAVVGFSMQSTLGSLIAGASLSADPLLKIGAAFHYNGDLLIVEQKTWRHVIGRRLDNTRVLIPNAVLGEMVLEVLPEDAPARFDVFLYLPPDIPPQRVTDALFDGFSDMEHIDASLPVMVAPVEARPGEDAILYRIRLWARSYVYIEDVLKGEVLRRCWYILNRAGIAQARNIDYTSPPWPEPSRKALANSATHHSDRDILNDEGVDLCHYRFAPSELLRFPQEDLGKVMLLVEGTATLEKDIYLNPLEHGRNLQSYLPPLDVEELSMIAKVRTIAHLLSELIGPVAEALVQDAMKNAANPQELIQKLADDLGEEDRACFVSKARALIYNPPRKKPGTRVTLIKDAAGRIIPDVELRAFSEVLAVTFHPNKS